MATSIIITAIEMREVFAKRGKWRVDFDKYTNLIDGPTDDINVSIPSAIDLILNPMYADHYLAMNSLHSDVDENKNRAYVTLHVSSTEEIELNGIKSKHFELTRFIRSDLVDYIYVDDESSRNKYTRCYFITFLHAELAQLCFTRLYDPIISQRTRPTTSDLNQTFVEFMRLKDQVYDSKWLQRKSVRCAIENQGHLDLLQIEEKRMNVAKKLLIELSTLEAIILEQNIADLREKQQDNSADCANARRAFNMHLYADELESIQRDRFQSHELSLQRAISTEIRFDPKGVSEFNSSFGAYTTSWKEYFDAKTDASQVEMHNKKHDRKIEMLAELHCYVDQPEILIKRAIDNCDKVIAAANTRFQSQSIANCEQDFENLLEAIYGDLRNYQDTAYKQTEELQARSREFLATQMESFQKTHDFLLCTNQLNAKQLGIDNLCCEYATMVPPMQINSWRKGMSILTSPEAHNKEVHTHFLGNVFDFVKSGVDGDLLSTLMPYFAMFIFKSTAKADAFKALVKPLLKDVHQVNVYGVDKLNADKGALPFQSLADHLLNQNTREANPLIKKWFDQFRVSVEEERSTVFRKLAMKYKCKIIHRRKCYHEDGSSSQMFDENAPGAVDTLLSHHQTLKTVRKEIITQQSEQFALEKELKMVKAATVKLAARLRTTEMNFIVYALQSELGMKRLFEVVDLLVKGRQMKFVQEIEKKIHEEKKTLLQNGNMQSNDTAKHAPDDSFVDVGSVLKGIREFKGCTEKIVENMVHRLLPLTEETALKFKQHVKTMRDNLVQLQAFDYKQQFNVTHAPHFQVDLNAICVRNAINAEKLLLNSIQRYPEMLSAEMKQQYRQLNLDELQQMKEQALENVPAGLILPEPIANYGKFAAHYGTINRDLALLDQIKQNHSEIQHSYDVAHWRLFFQSLVEVLLELNNLNLKELKMCGGLTIGLELFTSSATTHIFPDTQFDPSLSAQFDEETLCDMGTGLGFVLKTNRNSTVIKTDTLDVKAQRYSRLFHLILSIKANPSVLILNNTIVGLPISELKEIIERFQLHRRSDGQAQQSRQVIMVGRQNDAYVGLFRERQYKRLCFSSSNEN